MLNLAHQPLESLPRQAVLHQHALTCQLASNQAREEDRRIRLSLLGKQIVANHHHELTRRELLNLVHDAHWRQVRRPRTSRHLKHPLSIRDQPRHIQRQRPTRVAARNDVTPQIFQVSLQLIHLLLHLLLDLRVRHHALPRIVVHAIRLLVLVVAVAPHVNLRKLLLIPFQVVQRLRLNVLGSHAILAVQELDDVAVSISGRAIVLNPHILHRLDEPSLDVPRRRRLHGCVNQSLASAHGVEEKLLRR